MKKQFLGYYETDASQIKGKAKEVFIPSTITELTKKIPSLKHIVPRGAGTGLCGGAVPLHGEDTVIDTSKLSTIISIKEDRSEAEVEAGVVLSKLQEELSKRGYEFLINPASANVCTIGGMIATNASGPWLMKYGPISRWIKWIEVVDSKGIVSRKGVTEISDYVGREGITGIITKACLKIAKKKQRSATIRHYADPFSLLEDVKAYKRNSSVCSLEFFDATLSHSFGLAKEYMLLIEFEGLQGNLQEDSHHNAISYTEKAYTEAQKRGYTRIEDPKIIGNEIRNCIQWCEDRKIILFGSLGSGILHPCFAPTQEASIRELMKFLSHHNAIIGAQFGIGILKKEYVAHIDKTIIENIKKRRDKHYVFNKGKIL